MSVFIVYFSQFIQCSSFIMLYLGSIGIDCVITVLYYKGTILQRNNKGNYSRSIIK